MNRCLELVASTSQSTIFVAVSLHRDGVEADSFRRQQLLGSLEAGLQP
jgi:hypothetical protein